MSRSEPLLFALRRSLLRAFHGIHLTGAEDKMLNAYFTEGYMLLTPAEFDVLKGDPRNFTKGVVVVKANPLSAAVSEITKMGGAELMQVVDIKYRVGVRSTR